MAKSITRAPSHFSKRGATYQYRRRVPDDVRAMGGLGGKEHFTRSLKTSNLSDAKRRAADLSDWFDGEVRRAREGIADAPPREFTRGLDRTDATDDEAAKIAADWWKLGADRDSRERFVASVDDTSAEALDAQDDYVHELVASFNHGQRGQEFWRKHLENDVYPRIEHFVARACGIRSIQKGSAGYYKVREAVAQADFDLLYTRFERRGRFAHEQVQSAIVAKGMEVSAVKAEASWTLRQLANHVLKHQPKGASWQDKVLSTVHLFDSFVGKPKAIAEIERSEIRRFLEALARCPVRSAMRFPGKSITEAADLNDARSPAPYPRLSPNTIRDTHFAALRWLFVYAHVNLEVLEKNPTERIKIPGAIKRGGNRAVFSEDELNAFFQLPVFAGCKSGDRTGVQGSHKIDDHRFWAPLLMLFTGARPSELAQLSADDVKLDVSYPYISILTEYDESQPQAKPYVVAIKTKNARRDVPIHPELLRLGFDRYVRRMKAGTDERLFPGWLLSSDPRKLYSQASWIRQLNGVHIPKISSRHPTPTIYSLRHTCKTRMVACGVPAQHQNQILGHAMTGMDGHYFTGASIEDLSISLRKLSFPKLKIDHLIRGE